MFPFVQFLTLWSLLTESPGYKMKETLLQKQRLPVLKALIKYAFIAAPRMIRPKNNNMKVPLFDVTDSL